MITVIMGISFFANSKSPTYESVPYTVEEARVYVTDYGDCYHSSTCSYLRSSRNAIGKTIGEKMEIHILQIERAPRYYTQRHTI